MTTAILLTARLGSSRLPRKHLLPAAGRTMLGILAERIKRAFAASIENGTLVVAIATSDEPENRSFELFRESGVGVFYGVIHNIPLRHLQAARSLCVDRIVSVDGDDVLCSVRAMTLVFNALLGGQEYVKTSGLPFGMNAFGYSTQFLADSLRGNQDKILETGWPRIFAESRLGNIAMTTGVAFPEELRFTLDYPEDEVFFRALGEHFGDRIFEATDDEIIAVVIEQQLYRITDPIGARYWDNFNAARTKEAAAD